MAKKILFAINVMALAITILFQPLETKAAWGDFDTSFGFGGAAGDTITGYSPRSVTIQSDGKILVTGYRTTTFGSNGFFLRRYQSNGQLDTTFGTNGATIGPETNSINTDYRGDKIVVQANGKIAVAGWANGFYAVWQFNSNGTRDRTFGENGLQRLTNYPIIPSRYADMNVQSGKLLLIIRKQYGDSRRVVLVRLTLSGALDGAFGRAGESLTEADGYFSSGMVVETDGKITISGVKFDNINAKGLERKLANGQTDLSFFPTPSYSVGMLDSVLTKLANGKYATRIVNFGNNGSLTLTLDKYSPDGVLESVLTPYNGASFAGCPEVFTNQSDGKVLIQFLGRIFRLNSELDFSTMETNYCANLSQMGNLSRAAIQTDDKMVVAGVYNNYLMLVRLLPD